MRIDRWKIFLDSMGGGAWPFLVGGVICLVNSVNERDLNLLTSPVSRLPVSHGRGGNLAVCRRPGARWRHVRVGSTCKKDFLEGLLASSKGKLEAITGL